MYYVTPVLLTIIALYCLSYFFLRNRKFTIQLHFRFWNLIIAALFLLTAATGLLRILHTAPEWDAAYLKSMAGQHVVLGMAFISTGLLHFFLHYSRFRNLFKKRESDAPNEFYCRTQRTRGAIGANLFAVGFVSSAIQLLLLREILNISGGYELIAGQEKMTRSTLRPKDGIARRYQKVLENGHLAVSEFSIESAINSCDMLVDLQQKTSGVKERRILSDMSKMAAVLNYKNGSQGYTAEK